MSEIFKAKFKDQMKNHKLYSHIPDQVWQQSFNVDCQPVGSSARSIKYLAPYVFKVAISDYRIVELVNRQVLFKYKKTGSNRWRTVSLEVMEFIRRYLQHVLPTGLMKIRYYGFLNPDSSVSLSKISVLIQLAFGFWLRLPLATIEPPKMPTCPDCGANLIYYSSINPRWMTAAGAG